MDSSSSATNNVECAVSLDAGDVNHKPTTKKKSFISSLYTMVVGEKKIQDISVRETFMLSEKDVEDTLNDTIYISPSWLCNVLKGVIRHERDSLLRYFIKNNDQVMIRRVKRLLVCGRMHSSLAPFTYPMTAGSNEYWENNLSAYERELWPSAIVRSQGDIIRAFSVLSGFDLLAVKGHEFIIPSLLSTGTYLKASLSSYEQPYQCVFEYISLPSGFFERIIIRLGRLMSHVDMTSSAANLYSLGNSASMYVSIDTAAKICVNASSRVIFDDIKGEIYQVEHFFPGLYRTKIVESNQEKINDIAQILIVSSSVSKISTPLYSLIRSRYPKLIIAQQAGKPYSSDILRSRIAIVCIDKGLSRVQRAVSCIKSLHANGTFLIPVIMNGYQISDYTNWWPVELPEFEFHKLFVDLRSNFEIQVVDNLLPVVMKQLNEWRGNVTPECLASLESIPCNQCVVECCPSYSCFSLETCKKYIDDWYTLKLRMYEASSNGISSLVANVPPIKCANGHPYDPNEAISHSVVRDTIPCPLCIRDSTKTPYFFDRGDLIARFEDDVKKVGMVSCPTCTLMGRPGAFRIVDLLNTDIFVTYNWGNKKLSQQFIIPFVRKIELETDILCWFDIHGGLSAGQDHIQEMNIGVSKCSIFIVCLTDQYVVSENCLREFIQSAKLGKYMIPLLLPRVTVNGEESIGWSGENTVDWWRHAEKISVGLHDPDNRTSKIPWFVLQNFEPIDLRKLSESEYMSIACEEIICRILNRLHRGRSLKAFELTESSGTSTTTTTI